MLNTHASEDMNVSDSNLEELCEQRDKKFERRVNKFRAIHMTLAEAFDVWRIVPRMFLALYGAMLWWLVKWFTTSRTIEKTQCDSELIKLLAQQDHLTLLEIKSLACTVIDVINVTAPDTAHTVFATTVAGLATGVFAFYSNTGRQWTKGFVVWKLKNVDKQLEEALADEEKGE